MYLARSCALLNGCPSRFISPWLPGWLPNQISRYFDLCRQRFIDRYNEDRSGFWRNCGARAICVFVNLTDSKRIWTARSGLDWLIATLGLSGFWAAIRLGYKPTWLMVSGLLSALPYLASQVNIGYVMWFRFVLTIFIGFLAFTLTRLLCKGEWPDRASQRKPPGHILDDLKATTVLRESLVH